MHTLDIVDDLLVVLDADGNGCDCHVLTSYRAAKQQIQRWTHEYVINVAAAYRLVEEFFLARQDD